MTAALRGLDERKGYVLLSQKIPLNIALISGDVASYDIVVGDKDLIGNEDACIDHIGGTERSCESHEQDGGGNLQYKSYLIYTFSVFRFHVDIHFFIVKELCFGVKMIFS